MAGLCSIIKSVLLLLALTIDARAQFLEWDWVFTHQYLHWDREQDVERGRERGPERYRDYNGKGNQSCSLCVHVGEAADFLQSFDPFLQTHHTLRPPARSSFDSTYHAPGNFNRRTSSNHRSESKRNGGNRNGDGTRKVTKTERTTQRSTESFTRNSLKSSTENHMAYHSFVDSSSDNRNTQFLNAPKADSNRRQNENNPRSKSNTNVNESNVHKAAKQKQTNRQENRRNNSKLIVAQNKNTWDSVEIDFTDHKKEKRVPSYDNSANNHNSFANIKIPDTFPAYANEIKNPFDSSDQNESINYYEPENMTPNAYDKPQENHGSRNRPFSGQNSGTSSRPTPSTPVKVFEYNNRPIKTALEPVEYYDRPISTRPVDFWNNGKLDTANVGTTSTRNPENNRQTTESTSASKLTNTDKRPTNGAWITSHNERRPTNNAWGESPYVGQENYNNPISHGKQQEWTTQRPFSGYSGRQNDRRPWTTQNPFVSGIVRPVGNENRPPITNRPPKYDQRSRTPATRQPVYDGIAFPDDEDETPDLVIGPDEDYMSEAEKRRYIELSERMCDRYKELDTENVAAIPLLPSPEPVSVSVSKCIPINVPLVVGGKIVSIKEFPHMALLGWKNVHGAGYSWKCGGTLVSDQYVLTAAHCSYQERDNSVVTGPPRVVQLGSSYLDDPGAIVIRVSAAIRHPKYKIPSSYYDLAVLRLITKVTFSERIKPACLGAPPPPGNPIVATGWGRTEFGGDQSNELRSVSLPIWRMDECRKVLGTSRKLPNGPSWESQICAGEMAGGKDTCQGDSGGPAQVQEGCAWRVVAVTSLGRACGAARTPALYAIVQRAFVAAVAFGGR